MANIMNYLNNIKTAIYGKEVRSSLADGLQAVNKETEKATVVSSETKGRQDNLESRWDLVVSETTDGAEVIESRVDKEGNAHTTLKSRMDSDFEKTHETIQNVKETLKSEVEDNKYQIAVMSRNKVYIDGIRGDSPTEKINIAIANAPSGSEIIIDREYDVYGIDIKDKSNLKITGGSTLNLIGDGAYGFKLIGNVQNVEIENLSLKGSKDFLSKQYGITSSSGQNIVGAYIHDLNIQDVNAGISLNADLSGVYDNARVVGNKLKNMMGTEPGNGYGIHLANATNSIVEGNEIDGAERHSIYQAKGGKGNLIKRNTIKNHRLGAASGSYRPALYVARSSHVKVEDNLLIDCYDGCIMVSGDSTTGYGASDIDIIGNTIINPRNVVSPIICGEQMVPSVLTQRVNFMLNNIIYNNYPGGAMFKFLNGLDIKFALNNLTALGVNGTTVFGVELSDNFIADANQANGIKLHQNTFNFQGSLGSSRAHHVGVKYASGLMYVDIRNSSYIGSIYNSIEFGAPVTNPNLTYAQKTIAAARADTRGATLEALEKEVNELKKSLRELGLMKNL